jgi:hypothetical protein
MILLCRLVNFCRVFAGSYCLGLQGRALKMTLKIKTLLYFEMLVTTIRWPGSSVGIATGYGDRILVGSRFSAHVQNGPGAHPASCTMGTGSFPVVENDRGMTLTPHPF